MLRGSVVAQIAKSARSQENAASSGRFGNPRYDGPRNISQDLEKDASAPVRAGAAAAAWIF
jgi:hypothetical protein